MEQKGNVVFLSSSFINLAYLFAEKNPQIDVFLILDRKLPTNREDENLENFYSFTYDKNKIFEKDKEKYFDGLSIFIQNFDPNIIISSNYSKLIPNSFIEFLKFRNNKIKLINIHHADLSIRKNNQILYSGLKGMEKQFLLENKIVSSIHFIENEKMDEGKIIKKSHPSDLKEFKKKGFITSKEDILNYRIKNVIIAYHERNKILNMLSKIINELI
jgi:folate-dependent phosphoribosylglycinamide formyltransferase PurN